jgi:hypothetical protein
VLDYQAFERAGFAIVPDVIGPGVTAGLVEAISALRAGGPALERGGQVYASRDLLRTAPAVKALANSAQVRALVEPVLGPAAFPVRGLLFDKTPDANWMVPWHQDVTIAVLARVDAPGYGPWTVKAGGPHVRPPAEVLAKMVTVRLHLDEPDPRRGPLRVVPGSHRAGRLGAGEIRSWLDRVPPVTCLVPRRGALVMRPLLLHASSSAEEDSPSHRRVIHLEFAADPLPHGVSWADGPSCEAAAS